MKREIVDTTTYIRKAKYPTIIDHILCLFKGHVHDWSKAVLNKETIDLEVPPCSRCGAEYVSRMPKMKDSPPIPMTPRRKELMILFAEFKRPWN